MIEKQLLDLIDELEKLHSNEFNWNEYSAPDFITADNGRQIHFTSSARLALRELSQTIYSNRSKELPKIELENFIKTVRHTIANMYSDGLLNEFKTTQNRETIKLLKNKLEDSIKLAAVEFTHYFPAWTAGAEGVHTFNIGPVQFLSREEWIANVDFPERAKLMYGDSPDNNFRWKEILIDALTPPKQPPESFGLASSVYDAVHECPALIKVKVKGYEKEYSRKLARIVSKSALDCFSLLLGGSDLFHQQILHDERTTPIQIFTIVETDNQMWMPGGYLTKRLNNLSGAKAYAVLNDRNALQIAMGWILNGLIEPSAHKYPKLCNRWVTALDWFAEGNRESSDSIALAKIATSLDVLSSGGKFNGINEMVSSILTIDENEIVIPATNTSLRTLIKEIYDDGRSKILHGTYYDRLESFAEKRQQATHLARAVLIKIALGLEKYTGSDNDKGFREFSFNN